MYLFIYTYIMFRFKSIAGNLILALFLFWAQQAYAWVDSAWPYKVVVTATNTSVAPVVNQAVEIRLTAATVNPDYVWTVAGDDIRVYAADENTALTYYVSNWNSAAKTASIWVLIPNLPALASTDIYIYYGNTLVSTTGDPVTTLTEVGIKYHTRNSSLDPTSKAQAEAEFFSLADNVPGYGCTTVTNFTTINNSTLFAPPRNSDIAFLVDHTFLVTPGQAGVWNFRFGGDYGRGGGMYIDGQPIEEAWNDDLWWGFSWANTAETLEGTVNLTAGYHTIRMIGFEGCCDGGTSMEFMPPGGAWSAWSTANLTVRSASCAGTVVSQAVSGPIVSTSTKTWVDLNGGDVNLGDTIRYTITLQESSGYAAERLEVFDDIAAGFNGFSVVSIPAGAVDASLPAGGAFSKGLLDIRNIDVPASGSVTIVFDVVFSGPGPVTNAAVISNPGNVTNPTINALPVNVSEDFGDAPDSYLTLLASGGARHALSNFVFMGLAAPDAEADGIPSVNADGDDLSVSDDEDGVSTFTTLTATTSAYSVSIDTTNTSGANAILVGWIDFNRNGLFEATEAATTNVPDGTINGTVTLNWIGLTGLTIGNTYARFRISTDITLAATTPGGAMADGEVEDYPLTIFNSLSGACIPTGATAVYPWDGNTNDIGGIYNLVAGTATFNAQDYVAAQSAVFNGTTNQLQYSNNPFMNQSFVNMSILFWVKPNALAGIQTLYEEGGSGSGVAIRLNGANLEAATREGGVQQTLTTAFPSDGKWHFIGYSYANGNVTLYLDGVNVGSVATGFAAMAAHGNAGAFGATNSQDAFNAGAGNRYSGKMDEAAYYYAALTGANILSTYNCMKPVYDFGDAPVSYGAADHKIVNTLRLGATIDADTGNWGDGVDTGNNASDDDTPGDPAGGVDDEDSVAVFSPLPDTASAFSVSMSASNGTTAAATLIGWIDFNGNGVFEIAEAATSAIPAGSNNLPVTLNWTMTPPLVVGPTYLRLRLTTDATVTTATPTGMAVDGEAEDYQLVITGLPSLTVSKTVQAFSDPVNLLANPKAIPGAEMLYTILVINSGSGTADDINITDVIPANTDLILTDINPGAGPVAFIDGIAPDLPSGLTYSYTSLADLADSLDFSIDGIDWTYPPNPVSGIDNAVRHIRVKPTGSFSGASGGNNAAFSIQFKVRIQ